jgi:BirA family transcriptional regulator, biotin operon repressor / biotin---[acetyl-CoA-carboxylase] ligase
MEATGSWVSGEEVASRLKVTRTAVWKQVQSLRTRGYNIEATTKKGYRLKEVPDLLDPKLIRLGLKTETLGRDIICFREASSTNEEAKKIAPSSEDGTVVLAETQTSGRGRLERMWHSPTGGIWMSLIFKPDIPLSQVSGINMAVDVGLARAIESLGLKVGIKWPNDILIGEKKVCGILTEISAEIDRLNYAVVGIGLNANVDLELFLPEWNATSLSAELGQKVSRSDLIGTMLEEIEKAYCSVESDEIYNEWCRRSATLGRQVKIIQRSGDLYGEAISLFRDGALCIMLPNGVRQKILAGDCVHLRACGAQARKDGAT